MRMREGHNTEMETTTLTDIGIEYKLSVVTIDLVKSFIIFSVVGLGLNNKITVLYERYLYGAVLIFV